MSSAERPSFLLFGLAGNTLHGTPEAIKEASFTSWGALEVQHIERWIVAEPRLLGERLLVVTNQFAGFDRTKERSDILALDRLGRLVVIELKRDDSGPRQDLQALRYAAYSSTLGVADLFDLYLEHRVKRHDETLTHDQARERFEAHVGPDVDLAAIDEDIKPRVILVAGAFQVEVTATVLWLREAFGLDISCVRLVPYEVGSKRVVASSVIIPLPEASAYTVQRERKRQQAGDAARRLDWDRVRAVVEAIPKGWWMGYSDVAAAAGGSSRAGMAVGQFLTRTAGIENVHRVLRYDGTIADEWTGTIDGKTAGPEECRALLKGENLAFDEKGRADPTRRFRPGEQTAVHGPAEAVAAPSGGGDAG